MKVRSEREKTKVVIRHLPPSLTQSDLFQHIDSHFASRYNWFSFRPGNNSHKRQRHSRAYIDFKCPDDVFEFAEFFDGHVFVNERGAQHKVIVEYAPSQRVPKPSAKKDGREGTIFKDPDYLEFLKLIAKPQEHLPSAEIQLERKESEQVGASKETPIVTPLMEYIRQKRAVDSGMQASSAVAKVCRRSRAALPGKPGSGNIKRGSEKKKYVQKDNAKSATRKESKNMSAFIVVPRRDDQFAESSIKGISDIKTLHGVEGSISGIPLTSESGKKKFLLLKGKQQDIPSATEATVKQQNVQSGNSPISTPAKQNQRREASGRLIRSILLNNEARQSQSTTGTQHKIQILSSENGQRPSRRFGSRSGLNNQVSNHDAAQINSEGDSRRALDEKFIKRDLHGLGSSAKTEKRTRNKDRPDRGVWTPLRRSDVSHAGNDYSSSSLAQPTQSNPESAEGEVKENVPSGNRGGEFSASAGGHGGNPSIENGSQRNFIHHGASYVVKDDGAVSSISKGKPSKKSVGHSAHESRESRIPMQPRQSRRNYVEGSDLAESESNSKHFLKIILPSPIHANQMMQRIPEEFIKRFGDELSNVATVTVPDGRVWKMRLKKCGKDVSFRSKWREFVEYYSLGYGSYLVFRYEGNSKFRVLIFDTTSAEICYPDLDNRKRSKVDDQTRKKEHKEAIDEDDVNLKAWKKESDCSEIAKDASTKPKHPSVTCTIQPYRLYVRSHFSKKHLKPNVCMMLQNCNGEQWDVSCVCHNTRYGGMMLTRGWRKFVRDNDLSEGDPCVLELIETNPAVVLKLTVLGAPEYHSSRPH
uniref:TF-B3 domain-containing protein n=2 Tax=Glycine max TaxID=3847 RepID=A0A0R0KCT0_SOYBN